MLENSLLLFQTFLSRLQVHIVLQSLDIIRIVPLNTLEHGLDLGLHSFHDEEYLKKSWKNKFSFLRQACCGLVWLIVA